MLDVLSLISGSLLKVASINIDNTVFKLHYRVTVLILILFSLLVTCRQYIGNPIECLSPSTLIPNAILDEYCWVSTTFTLPHIESKRVGIDVPHPGVDRSTENEERVYHQYYQWVCFVFFLQAIMFYVPHFLWKSWEGGRLKALTMGLGILPFLNEAELDVKKMAIVTYFCKTLHRHNFYFFRYFACEILNLINVLGQIYFTNRFLGGAFTTYGIEVLSHSETTNQHMRTDPMVKVFPRVTKCTFHTFGASGDVQKYDALCILPINIINEKLYIFLWFWFIILTVISAMTVLYRVLIIATPHFRLALMRNASRFSPQEYVYIVNRRIHVGDWFLIHLLGKNIDNTSFGSILAALAKSFEDADLGSDNKLV